MRVKTVIRQRNRQRKTLRVPRSYERNGNVATIGLLLLLLLDRMRFGAEYAENVNYVVKS